MFFETVSEGPQPANAPLRDTGQTQQIAAQPGQERVASSVRPDLYPFASVMGRTTRVETARIRHHQRILRHRQRFCRRQVHQCQSILIDAGRTAR